MTWRGFSAFCALSLVVLLCAWTVERRWERDTVRWLAGFQ